MRRGLVALGDSITCGRGGSPTLGVHPQSWALWLAEALGLPVTNLGVDGAIAADLVRGQLPRLEPPYDVATVFVGANDTRSVGWDPDAFGREVATVLTRLREAADRVLLLTVPLDLGRPPAGDKPAAANAILRRLAGDDVAVCALDDLAGPRVMLPDAVHPTSAGMVEIADRAARALGAAVLPSSLPHADARTDPWARAAYAAWYARQELRDRRRRWQEAR
jgi:lysophospholipase L1-like esterase